MSYRRPAAQIQLGAIILPPERELRLWMRRHAAERGLSESALHLTVRDVREGAPDKKGRWLIFSCEHAPEWGANGSRFVFRVRPHTPWPILAST